MYAFVFPVEKEQAIWSRSKDKVPELFHVGGIIVREVVAPLSDAYALGCRPERKQGYQYYEDDRKDIFFHLSLDNSTLLTVFPAKYCRSKVSFSETDSSSLFGFCSDIQWKDTSLLL
jgi:hypothetical protein